jgi:4-aminobutyrate--pyruvate transaminase
LIYLPKYSPDLNPIRLAFSKLKAHLRTAAERTILRLLRRHRGSRGAAEGRQIRGLSVTYIPNSIEARDVASLVHMQTDLRKHQQAGPLVIVRGEGCRVFDDFGHDYIESVAGLWCASLGFGSERLAKVAYEQMRKLGYYHLYRHRSTEPAVALAEKLLEIAPVPMARAVFQCSGSEANDTAIKLAWYYWDAMGQPQRKKIIARRMAYHGNTCAAVSLSGKPEMHAGFGLPLAPFKHTEFPHYYATTSGARARSRSGHSSRIVCCDAQRRLDQPLLRDLLRLS